jgi:hypothetical protein
MKDDGRTDKPAARVPKDSWKTAEEQQDKEKRTGQQGTSSTHQRTMMDEY